METVLPQQPANPDNLPEVIGQACSPFAEEYITLSKEEHIDLTCSAKYWQSQHARALDRETALKKRVAELEAEVRNIKQRLYGKKSEKGGTTKNEGNGRGGNTRRRG
jgi:transposase